MSEEAEDEDREEPNRDETGYKKPPKSGQFKKGQSGNPKGRPKRKRKPPRPLPDAVRIADRILSESRRPVKVRENGKVEEIPTIDAVLRSLAARAMQGSTRAQVAYAQLTDRAEATIIKDWNAAVDSAMEYKARWREDFEACDRRRVPRPEPVPHPDEILIDHAAMEIRYNGPTNEAQARRWEEQRERVRKIRRGIREMKAELHDVEPKLRPFYEEEIAWELATVARIDSMIPDKETRRAPGFDLLRWRAEKSVEGISPRDLMQRYLAELRAPKSRH